MRPSWGCPLHRGQWCCSRGGCLQCHPDPGQLSCTGQQATGDLFCGCILGPQPASKRGLAVPVLRFHGRFSLAARTGSSSSSTCTTTTAISPTAQCAARAASYCSAATRAAAGELRAPRVRWQLGPRAPKPDLGIPAARRSLWHRDMEPN